MRGSPQLTVLQAQKLVYDLLCSLTFVFFLFSRMYTLTLFTCFLCQILGVVWLRSAERTPSPSGW